MTYYFLVGKINKEYILIKNRNYGRQVRGGEGGGFSMNSEEKEF
jgi:hypothetical protein